MLQQGIIVQDSIKLNSCNIEKDEQKKLVVKYKTSADKKEKGLKYVSILAGLELIIIALIL